MGNPPPQRQEVKRPNTQQECDNKIKQEAQGPCEVTQRADCDTHGINAVYDLPCQESEHIYLAIRRHYMYHNIKQRYSYCFHAGILATSVSPSFTFLTYFNPALH